MLVFLICLICLCRMASLVSLLGLVLSVAVSIHAQSDGCTAVLDLALVVDSSGSINDADPANWDLVRTFTQEIARRFTIGENAVRIGVTKFSNNGNVEFFLNR